MRVLVRVKTRAGEERVSRAPDGSFLVSVNEPPEHGLANKAVLRALAEACDVPRSSVRIVSGAGSRTKMVELPSCIL